MEKNQLAYIDDLLGLTVKDVFEVGGSLGGGFPLGRKGTTVDLAVQGGKRFADIDNQWDETFIGLRVGLTGIATWGMERR